MKREMTRWLAGSILGCFVLIGPAPAADDPVVIYTDSYAGDEAISRVARDLIEANYDTPVQLKKVSVGVSFIGTAKNKRAMFLAAWLPKTHENYMARVEDQVENLGTIYNGARLGWAVPTYVPKDALADLDDLKEPEVADRLGNRIQGISAGAGLMVVSHKAVESYGLDDYRLTTASGSAMTAALKRAIDDKEWIVVTAWSPHWMWERFDLRYLDDPKKALGEQERVDAIANPALKNEAPDMYALIKRMKFTLDQVNTMLAYANKTSYDAAAQRFIEQHPDLVQTWVGDS